MVLMHSFVILINCLLLGDSLDRKPLQQFLATDFVVFSSNYSLGLGVGTKRPMANPGAEFNVTDAVEDEALPFQRLCFGGQSDSLWFVFFEQGGIAHSWNMTLFKPNGKSVVVLASYWLSWSKPVRTLDSLKQFVRTARLVAIDEDWNRKDDEDLLVSLPPSRVYFARQR